MRQRLRQCVPGLLVLLFCTGSAAWPLVAQQRPDTARIRRDSAGKRLAVVVVRARRTPGSVTDAPRYVAGMFNTTGAKREVVAVAGTAANVAEKVGRQLFAEVPGVFVYDMDGSGNQMNISARGLDAHRSWEFNVRQNGVVTNSDVYGYPASHYSAPMEAIERVEIVRGTAALQYGSQFGGLINYVVRSPDTTRALTVESRSSAGSFGLRSSWNAVGGKIGRVTYYGYASFRQSAGFRANGRSESDAEFLSASLPLTSSLSVRAEVARSRYLYRQPGPLTDAMFAADPRAATRSRNFYSPDILLPSLTLTWTPRPSTRASFLASGVFGDRSSVAVGGFATQPDTSSAASVFSARQVDIDRYDSRTYEFRLLQDFALGSVPTTLSTGVVISDNAMGRRQRGVGSRGSDYDLTLQPGATFQRDLRYLTTNVAVFSELELQLSPRLTVVPGFRVERGTTRMRGTLAYYDPADVPRNVSHNFPLFGIRTAYRIAGGGEWYSGLSQAYRPMILKDVLPETATERTDPNIRDARGWTVESGVRRTLSGGLSVDASVFAMQYANRFGMLTLTDSAGTPFTYKTNVGTTRTIGLEARIGLPLGTLAGASWRTFGAASLMDARYRRGSVAAGGRNVDIRNNEVESAPRWIVRSGIAGVHDRMSGSVQISHVSRTFADALNTVVPSATGATGIVPAYTLVDVTGSLTLTRLLRLTGGVNNAFDRQYFTKRPQFYPGPGVWPSDGRSIYLSLGVGR